MSHSPSTLPHLLQSTRNLGRLQLINFCWQTREWMNLCDALPSNSRLDRLSLKNCAFDEDTTNQLVPAGHSRTKSFVRPVYLEISHAGTEMFHDHDATSVLARLLTGSSLYDIRSRFHERNHGPLQRINPLFRICSLHLGDVYQTEFVDIALCLPLTAHLRDLSLEYDAEDGDADEVLDAFRANGSLHSVSIQERGQGHFVGPRRMRWIHAYSERNQKTPQLMCRPGETHGLVPLLVEAGQPAVRIAHHTVWLGLLAATEAAIGPNDTSETS